MDAEKFAEKVAELEKEAFSKQVSFRPAGNRYLLKRVKPEDVRASGIIIPEKAQIKQQWGIVIVVGTGEYQPALGTRKEPDFKRGDLVMFDQYGGEDVNIDGDEYLIIKEHAIAGVKE